LVALGQTTFGDAGPRPVGRGVADPLETCFSPLVLPHKIWSFYVKPFKLNYVDLPEKHDPLHPPFKVTQGHCNRHWSTSNLSLPISVP